MDDDAADPRALLRNLRELLAIDHAFGVGMLPRPTEAARATSTAPATSPAAASSSPAPSPAAADHPATAIARTDHPATAIARTGDADADLAAIAAAVRTCTLCGLCQGRTQGVPGEGSPRPEICFIGEGPGADEDRQGRPFVGAAGQLLDRMIAAMGFARAEVFIANIVKCRPPDNRTPEPDEVTACLPWLEAQIDLLQPKVICTLGNTPLRALSGADRPGITRRRGQPFTWRGYHCIPTFHPSYLLRNAAGKKPAWDDLKQVLAFLGREPPGA